MVRKSRTEQAADALRGRADLPIVDAIRLDAMRVRVPDGVALAESPADGDGYLYLVFSFRGNGGGRYEDPRGALHEFIRLHDAPEAQVLEFARRWGPLGLCRAHARPYTHPGTGELCSPYRKEESEAWGRKLRSSRQQLQGSLPGPADRAGEPSEGEIIEVLGDDPRAVHLEGRYHLRETEEGYSGVTYPVMGERIERTGTYWEPITAWYRYAEHMRGILSVWASLQRGEQGELKDWQSMMEAELDVVRPPENRRFVEEESHRFTELPYDPVERDKRALASVVLRWKELARLEIGNVSLTDKLDLIVVPNYADGIAGILAYELMAALGSSRGVYRCDSCGNPYSPLQRAPKLGYRHYCPSCSSPHGLGNDVASKRISAQLRRMNERSQRSKQE